MLEPNYPAGSFFSYSSRCPACNTEYDVVTLICPQDGTVLAQGMLPGTVVAGRYAYICTVGTGGMGIVVKAHDDRLDIDVALKLLLKSNEKMEVLRFKKEALAASLLVHESIVKVYDFGVTDGGLPYMSMEFVAGENLATMLQEHGAIQPSRVFEIFAPLCEAMQYAHSKGVLHRDLKPSNLMIRDESGKCFVKLVDFGIAKIMPGQGYSDTKLTHTGQIIGSPLYMSPEQALGRPVDVRTDIYSVGCMLYHALTGAPPIGGETAMETLFKHVNYVPPPLTEASLGNSFSIALEDVVSKAIRKNPSERQQSFLELKDELTRALHDKIALRSERALELKSKGRTKPLIVWSVLIVFMSMAAILTLNELFVRHAKQPDGPIDRARVSSQAGTSSSPDRSHQAADLGAQNEELLGLELNADDAARFKIRSAFQQKSPFIDLAMPRGSSNQAMVFLCKELETNPERLRSLDLHDSSIDDDGIKKLVELAPRLDLKSLAAGQCRVGKAGLRLISKLQTLDKLNIGWMPKLDDSSLVCLGDLHNLKELYMEGCYLKTSSPINLDFLSRLSKLETLWAASNSGAIDDKSAKFISRLKNIRNLDLSWDSVGDEGLISLSSMSRLEKLNLSGERITDRSIPSLSSLVNLKELALSHATITDNSLDVLLRMYEKREIDLARLELLSCPRVTPAACIRLQQEMPHCLIVWRPQQPKPKDDEP